MSAHSAGTPAIPPVAWDQPETGRQQWLRDIAQSLNLVSSWIGTATDSGGAGAGVYVAKSGDTMTGTLYNTAAALSTGAFHMTNGSAGIGSMWYNDGGTTYLLLTNSGNALGGYNGLRPFLVDNTSGLVSGNHGFRATNSTTNIGFQVLSSGSSSGYFFDDGNTHIEANTALWLNGNTAAAVYSGGDFNIQGAHYLYMGGHRALYSDGANGGYNKFYSNDPANIALYSGGTNDPQNYYRNTLHTFQGRDNDSSPTFATIKSGELRMNGHIWVNLNGNWLWGVDTAGNSKALIGLNTDNNIHINASGGRNVYIDGGEVVTTGGSFWSSNDIICGNNSWFYGRTNSSNIYQIAGCVSNQNWLGNASWNTYIRASNSIYCNTCHIAPSDNNARYCGHSGLNWFQVTAYGFINPSDVNLKHDIADMPSCFDVVRAIRPKTFKYNDSPDDHTHWGFVAQDVAAGMREAGYDFGGHIPADGDLNPTEGLAYHELVAVLWRAVQELAAKLETRDG